MFNFFKRKQTNKAVIKNNNITSAFPSTIIKPVGDGWIVKVLKDDVKIFASEFSKNSSNELYQSWNGVEIRVLPVHNNSITVITSFEKKHEERTINIKTGEILSYPRY